MTDDGETWIGPVVNPMWWDHPEADPLQDMRDFVARQQAAPTPIHHPTVVPEWMQHRYGLDVWGNPIDDQSHQ